jgi:hypothetical protein
LFFLVPGLNYATETVAIPPRSKSNDQAKLLACPPALLDLVSDLLSEEDTDVDGVTAAEAAVVDPVPDDVGEAVLVDVVDVDTDLYRVYCYYCFLTKSS